MPSSPAPSDSHSGPRRAYRWLRGAQGDAAAAHGRDAGRAGRELRGRADCRGRRGYVMRPGGAPMVPPAAPKLAARAGEWQRASADHRERVREAEAGPGPAGAGRREDGPAPPLPSPC